MDYSKAAKRAVSKIVTNDSDEALMTPVEADEVPAIETPPKKSSLKTQETQKAADNKQGTSTSNVSTSPPELELDDDGDANMTEAEKTALANKKANEGSNKSADDCNEDNTIYSVQRDGLLLETS